MRPAEHPETSRQVLRGGGICKAGLQIRPADAAASLAAENHSFSPQCCFFRSRQEVVAELTWALKAIRSRKLHLRKTKGGSG